MLMGKGMAVRGRLATRGVPALLCAVIVAGCAYPRRGTPLTRVRGSVPAIERPADVWQFRLIDVRVPELQRSGLAWDDDGRPDPFVRLYRDDTLVYEWATHQDQLHPRWDEAVPENVRLPRASAI